MPATVGIGNMVFAGKARSYGRARGVHEVVVGLGGRYAVTRQELRQGIICRVTRHNPGQGFCRITLR